MHCEKHTISRVILVNHIKTIIIGICLLSVVLCAYIFRFSLFGLLLSNKASPIIGYVVAAVVVCVAAWYIVMPVIHIFFKTTIRKVQDYADSMRISDQEMYVDYNTAHKINGVRIGNDFTYLKKHNNIIIIPNFDIVWVYKTCLTKTVTKVDGNGVSLGETSRRKRYSLTIRTINKKKYDVPFYNEKHISDFFSDYAQFPHIILGYDNEYERLYSGDMKSFLELQYNAYATGPRKKKFSEQSL